MDRDCLIFIPTLFKTWESYALRGFCKISRLVNEGAGTTIFLVKFLEFVDIDKLQSNTYVSINKTCVDAIASP